MGDGQAAAIRAERQLVDGCAVRRRLERGDPPSRSRIEQRHSARNVADREHVFVGAQGGGQDPFAVGAEDPDRGGALEQGGEQVAAGLRRVVERDALARQQQRAIEVGLDEGARAQAQCIGGRGLVACVAPLRERDETGDHRQREQCRDPGERGPQAAPLALARGAARGQESALARIDVGFVVGPPLQRRSEACAAIQLAGVAAACIPGGRSVAQVVVQATALRILLQPAPEARPFAQQRLVRDLDLAFADRHQPIAREHGQHLSDALVTVGLELSHRDAPARRRRALALFRQAEQDPARGLALLEIEPLVGALGQPRHGAVQTAGALIGVQPQLVAVTVLPQLEQAGREQRQRAGLAGDVVEQRIDELWLDGHPGAPSRQLDRAPQLVAPHRTHQNVVGAEQRRQLRIGGAATVEVRPQGDEHERPPALVARAVDERVDERGPLGLLDAGGEQLLELIHRQDQPFLRSRLLERSQRPAAGAHQHDRPALAAR